MKKKILILTIILLVVTTSIFASELSNIDGIGDITSPFQKAIDIFTGSIARIIATLAVIGLGYELLFGGQWVTKHKIKLIVIIVSIVIIFGAASLIDYFSGDMESKGALVNSLENIGVLRSW